MPNRSGILPSHSSKPMHRKSNRLPGYDYGSTGAYFITVCNKNKEQIFSTIPRSGILPPQTTKPESNRNGILPPHPTLTAIGAVIEQEIIRIPEIYDNVTIAKFVIMPNHVHMIIEMRDDGGRMPPQHNSGKMPLPRNARTLGQIINQWKRAISIKLGFSPWQKSFHDHVIRNQEDYNRIAEYIENNPIKWSEDRYSALL